MVEENEEINSRTDSLVIDYYRDQPMNSKEREMILRYSATRKNNIDLTQLLDKLEKTPTSDWRSWQPQSSYYYPKEPRYIHHFPFGGYVQIVAFTTKDISDKLEISAKLIIFTKKISIFPNNKEEQHHLIVEYPPTNDINKFNPTVEYHPPKEEITIRILCLYNKIAREIVQENKIRIENEMQEFINNYNQWIKETKENFK